MRTTVSIDNALYHQIENQAAISHRSLKEVINEALRTGMAFLSQGERDTPPFVVRPIDSRLRAGIDEVRLKGYLDEFDEADFAAKGTTR